MDPDKTYVPNNIPADLDQSWHIPRPTLARSSKSSQGSTSSNNSTQSAYSGSLLLTAANLAKIHTDFDQVLGNREQNLKYYLKQGDPRGVLPPLGRKPKDPDPDSVSMASSTHFTVVNVNSRPPVKPRSFCRKHQLTILVVTMSTLFMLGIVCAIIFLEMRARRHRY